MPEQDDEKILAQMREDFRYVKDYWRENREASEKDMDLVACVPPAEFQQDREGRPCIWPDEVSQYVKQANNNLRQNSRSIKISPRSEDAKQQDAEHRQSYVRGIEDASKAQSIYATAFEAAVECAFGFWRIKTIVTGRKGEQEPRLRRVPNQFSVYPDPDAAEADFSDSSIYFVMCPPMREKTFAKKYPKAKKKDFTKDDREAAPEWLSGGNVLIAEYWTREEVARKEDDEDGEPCYKVMQYVSNGVEILESNEWIGSWIPLVGVFGEEIYVKRGAEVKRLFLSLIRRAQGPQTMLAYIASQEAEEFGIAPRAPLQGYKGQFDPEQHKNLHRVPAAYVEYDVPPDWNAQWGPPPLPSRVPFSPNTQAYEMAYERWRRSIQAAVGNSPLPTAAQRQNEKSGVALEKIQNETAAGSFHFTDNFVRALINTGRQLNELITRLAELDSLPAQLLGKDQKGEDVPLKVAPRQPAPADPNAAPNTDPNVVPNSIPNTDPNTNPTDPFAQPLDPASEHLPESDYFFAHRGQFEVTVSDGPNYRSQREEASSFADTLLQTMPALGLPPAIVQQILAIAVKLKNIGTYGDEIADLLSPPDPNKLPPQAKALLAQAQGQVQAAQAEVQQLKLEKLGKVIETKGKMDLATVEHATRIAEADKDRETKLAVAEVMTKAQNISERLSAFEDLMKQFHEQAHDLASSITQHTQAKELAAQNAEQAQAAAASQAASQPQPGQQPDAQQAPQV